MGEHFLGPQPASTYVIPFLKYLFDVEFTDGTTYTQNAEDRSLIDPEKRSCFFDVMQALENGKKIKYFMLSNGKDVYAVDLRDGHFEINGKSFYMHDRRDLCDLKIVFYRQHDIAFTLGQIYSPLEKERSTVFCFGWQVTVDGENIKRVMEID